MLSVPKRTPTPFFFMKTDGCFCKPHLAICICAVLLCCTFLFVGKYKKYCNTKYYHNKQNAIILQEYKIIQ